MSDLPILETFRTSYEESRRALLTASAPPDPYEYPRFMQFGGMQLTFHGFVRFQQAVSRQHGEHQRVRGRRLPAWFLLFAACHATAAAVAPGPIPTSVA